MTNQIILELEKKYLKKDWPEIKPGMYVRVWQRIQEKKRTLSQPFEGIVIAVKNKNNLRKMFTVRGEVAGQMVEKIYPYHSPTIEKIEILKIGKARRAKLYFVRKLHPRKIKAKLKI